MLQTHFFIGVGASAGGLEALTELFAHLPETLRNNTSFIVAQHLSPNYRNMLVQILDKEAVFPVVQAENNQIVKTGVIYITPPDFDVQVLGGLIYLSKPLSAHDPKPSVDMLLSSLANEYGQKAIAIILSGTGSDGAVGLKEVKMKGGMAIIQNSDTAKFDGMPLASLQTGLVDYSLPPNKIGAKIAEIVFDTTVKSSIIATIDNDLAHIFELLYSRFGTNFATYKPSTILRRIDKQIKNTKLKNIKQYAKYLDKNPHELQVLYESFLIHVTSFFRDGEPYQKLAEVLESKIAKPNLPTTFRVWVAGCSTGEEAYSLAMLIQNLLDQYKKFDCVLQIFATDLDENALQIARKGIYPAEKITQIPTSLLEKYMTKTDKGYEVEKSLRSCILFSKHDITINPPFLKLDVLSCRNLLIYLDNGIQRQIFSIFHYALKEEGTLFLGKSESITQVSDLFDTLEAKHKIFKKRKFSTIRPSLKFIAFKPMGFTNEWDKKRNNSTFQNYRNRLLETFADLTQHAYIVLNPLLDIMETKGDLSDFMQIPEGALNLNISRLLRKEIVIEVKNLVLQVIKEKKSVRSTLKKVVINHKKLYIKFQCALMSKDLNGDGEELYLLVFERYDLEDEIERVIPKAVELTENPRVFELEEELNVTKEHLQTYIEEIETANEELQTANEELQSANEELETGNEELQSSNEELQTAYSEIKYINLELTDKENAIKEANTLFSTLFENTQQGNILIQNDLQIRLLNTEARYLFKQIGLDDLKIGKNFIDLLSNHLIEKLLPAIKQVQKNLEVIKEVVEIIHQNTPYYYEFCLTPVRATFENKVDFITIGILDLTLFKKREKEIFQRDEMFMSLLNSNSSYLIRTNVEGEYTHVNDAFCRKFGFTRAQCIGKHYRHTAHSEDLNEYEKAVVKLFENPQGVVTFEIRKPNPKGGYFHTEWEFIAIKNLAGEILEIQGIGRDITEFKLTQQILEAERNHFETILWGGMLGTWDWNIQTGKIIFNDRWANMLGYTLAEVDLDIKGWENLIHPDDKENVINALHETIIGNTAYYSVEHRKITKSSEWKWFLATGKVIERDKKGNALRIVGIHQDITEKKRAEVAEKISEALNKSVFDTMQEGIVVQDMTSAIVSCNKSAEKILGLTYDQMMGKTLIDKSWRAIKEDGTPFPGEEHPAMYTIRTGTPQNNIIMGVHKPNHELVWISINSQLLYHPDTKVAYAVFCIFHDITNIKRATTKIQETEEKYRRIVETQTDFVLLSKPDTTITYVNEALMKALGVTKTEIIGAKWIDFANAQDIQNMEEKIKKLTPQNANFFMENRDVRAGGLIGWTQWINQGFFDEEGTLIHMQSVGHDVTEARIAQQEVTERNQQLATSAKELRASFDELVIANQKISEREESLNQAQSIAKIGSWEFDLQTFNLTWSREHYRIFEIPQETLPEKLYEAYRNKIHPDDIPTLDQAVQNAIDKGEGFVYGYRMMRQDNSLKYIISIGEVVKDTQGNPALMRGTVQDITKRKHIEMALSAEKKRFKDIVDSTDGIVWEIDFATLQFTYVSQKGIRLTGYELAEWYAPDFWVSHLHPDDKLWAIDFCLNASKQLLPCEFEYRFLTKDGRIIWLRDIVSVVVEKGKPIFLRGILLDITTQKEAEAHLLKTNERLTQLENFIDLTTDAIQVAGKNGYLVYINKIASDRLGIPQSQAHQYKVGDFEVLFHENEEAWQKHLHELKQTSHMNVEGINLNQKTGLHFPVEVTARHIMMQGKDYVIAVSRDITERKEAEKQRTELLNRFEKISQNLPGFFYQYCLQADGTSYFPYASAGIERLFHLPLEKLMQDASPIFTLMHPDDLAYFRKSIIESAENLTVWKQEWRMVYENKTTWLGGSSTPQRFENGDVVWYGYVSDVQAQKEMEAELYKLSLVAKNTYNGVMITDTSYKIVWVNDAFTEITGYVLTDVAGKTPRIFQFEGTNQATTQYINEKLSKSEPVYCELLNKGKHGKIYWLEMEIQPLFDDKQQLTGFMALQTDITQRKEAQGKIDTQNKALRDIAFFQSHILRRPVANVMGLCNLLEMAKEEGNITLIYEYLGLLNISIHETDEAIHQIVAAANEIED